MWYAHLELRLYWIVGMSKKTKPSLSGIETDQRPDAQERFERAVDIALHTPPMPKPTKEKASASDALTPSEKQSLKQAAKDQSKVAQKAFAKKKPK